MTQSEWNANRTTIDNAKKAIIWSEIDAHVGLNNEQNDENFQTPFC